MMTPVTIALFCLSVAGPAATVPPTHQAPAVEPKKQIVKEIGAEVTLTMEACRQSRAASDLLRRALGQKDSLLKRADVEVDGVKYTVYLPHPRMGYTIKTSKASVLRDSTALGIDNDGDGSVSVSENFHAHELVRIGNTMFRVNHIAADGNEIKLQRTDAPATSLTRGQSSPTLTFNGTNGKTVSTKSSLGKTLLIKFWSPT